MATAYLFGAVGFALALLALEQHPQGPRQWFVFAAGVMWWPAFGIYLLVDPVQRRRRMR